ncbi:MAG: rod shape-determining protein MreC [Mariprofundales bacterium]|nr:rod shape-determining protein MreC [Mariprofundales bacterium]
MHRIFMLLLITVLAITALVGGRHADVGQRLLLWSAPFIEQLRAPSRWVEHASQWLQRQSMLQTKLSHANARLHRASAQTGELQYLRQENAELRRLLAIPIQSDYVWHVAEVVARSLGVPEHGLLLAVTGVAVDDAVIAASGLVGIVTAVHGDYATVRTIFDGSIAIPVTNKLGRVAALIRGDDTSLMVNMVAKRERPTMGELLITSGAGGLLPLGIPVATIQRVTPQAGSMFVAVDASPVAQWQHMRWLAVAHRRHSPPLSP